MDTEHNHPGALLYKIEQLESEVAKQRARAVQAEQSLGDRYRMDVIDLFVFFFAISGFAGWAVFILNEGVLCI